MTRIKICGLCDEVDARYAAACGADLLGFVLAESPRRADPPAVARWLPALRAAFPAVRVVGVFVRPSPAEVREAVDRLALDYVQLHGVVGVDAGGGSGRAGADRPSVIGGVARREPAPPAVPRPLILASGPNDLAAAAGVRPWAVLVDRAGPRGGGGTGVSLDWADLGARLPASLRNPEAAGAPHLLLAGGLAAGNVARAIDLIHPWGVDASSRLESSPGRKDPEKVAAFCAAVREIDRSPAEGTS